MSRFVGALDQGTTSTRFIIFDADGGIVATAQREHAQIYPQPGWVEHDPLEIIGNTHAVIESALQRAELTGRDIAAVGLTNQRETTLVWRRRDSTPLHNALVWQDTRVEPLVAELCAQGGKDRFRERTGLPLSTYFSSLKLRWLLDHIPAARALAASGELCFGTMDSWLLWNLCGGRHLTDVTNASRTQLMNLGSLDWDPQLLQSFDVPASLLPRIVSSSEIYGEIALGPLRGVPIAGVLGDQQAALVGQGCFTPGEAKNTYGTGCFLLMNTGTEPIQSHAGLLTTIAYRFGAAPACYALEGSVAIAGALVQWLRDNLGIIASSKEIEALAASVDDNGDVYIVPAFAGLFAPYWQETARGVIAGLTGYATKAHLARATLEATAFQTCDVLAAMQQDSGIALRELKVDGGMVVNELLMQFQADMLATDVIRPRITETTALGAAYAAGLAIGYWKDLEQIKQQWALDRRWRPTVAAARREQLYASWQKAVQRSLAWV